MADARLLTAGADEQSGERLVDVSHKASIRSWPRLRKWIDEDRASLRLLRRVTEAAQEWQRSVVMWHAAQEQAKIANDQRLVAQSGRATAEEQAKIANKQSIAARTARVTAEEQAKIAESRRLAAESSSGLAKYPQSSLLLAVEALKVVQPLHGVRVATAEQSLREALGVIAGRPLVISQSSISAAAISVDNHWLVTGSSDKTARLWDLRAKDPAAARSCCMAMRGRSVRWRSARITTGW
jgi:WD40 repeat protein